MGRFKTIYLKISTTVALNQASNKICRGFYIDKEKHKNIRNPMNICTVLGIDSILSHITSLYKRSIENVPQILLLTVLSKWMIPNHEMTKQ